MQYPKFTFRFIFKFFFSLIFTIFLISCIGNQTPNQQNSATAIGVGIGQNGTSTSHVIETTPEAIVDTPEANSVENSSIPDPKKYVWEVVAEGFTSPVGLASPHDDTGRIFVIERSGRIQLVKDGWVQIEPFLDITVNVSIDVAVERGLLNMVFHPEYPKNGIFYVYYTALSGNVVISQFSVASDNPDQADPGSERIILEIPQPGAEHNGGGLVFGPDGYLYIGVGDGIFFEDPQPENSAQDLNSLLGKILRIDVNGQDGSYAIPSENPFAKQGGRPEIWAYGLRNPWRIAFNTQTSEVFIADVGQLNWEEINYLPEIVNEAPNFGWNYLEAWEEYIEAPSDLGRLRFPIIEYPHSDGGCAVIGGEVYAGEAMPEWQDVYFFGDFCLGSVWGAHKNDDDSWETRPLYGLGRQVTSFGLDQQGDIYVVDIGGRVQKLIPAPQP